MTMSQLHNLIAQDTALPTSQTTLGIGALIATSVTAVWTWFRSELNDCKQDRKQLYARLDQLHAEVSQLSLRVGHCETVVPRKNVSDGI